MLVGYDAVKDGILQCGLQFADFAAGWECKALHDFFAVHGRLEVTDAILLLNLFQFLTYKAEVLQEVAFLHLVAARDVGLAQAHEVVDVVARLKKETTHGAVGHLVVGDDDGTHVQSYQLFYVLHALVKGQLEASEQGDNHLLAQEVVVVERPSGDRIPAL